MNYDPSSRLEPVHELETQTDIKNTTAPQTWLTKGNETGNRLFQLHPNTHQPLSLPWFNLVIYSGRKFDQQRSIKDAWKRITNNVRNSFFTAHFLCHFINRQIPLSFNTHTHTHTLYLLRWCFRWLSLWLWEPTHPWRQRGAGQEVAADRKRGSRK